MAASSKLTQPPVREGCPRGKWHECQPRVRGPSTGSNPNSWSARPGATPSLPPMAPVLLSGVPARQRYPAPHQQLLTLARTARERGVPFDDFWAQALPPPKHACLSCQHPVGAGKRCTKCGDLPGPDVAEDDHGRLVPDGALHRVDRPGAPAGRVLFPHDKTKPWEMYDALASSKEAWRRAYEGKPARSSEAALAYLAPLFERQEEAA